jgi:hypothetical protein
MRFNFLSWFGGRVCGVSGLSFGIKGDGYGSDTFRGLRCGMRLTSASSLSLLTPRPVYPSLTRSSEREGKQIENDDGDFIIVCAVAVYLYCIQTILPTSQTIKLAQTLLENDRAVLLEYCDFD